MTSSTHASLLGRLGDWDDHEAWRALEARFGGIILRYALSRGLQLADAEEVRQQVLFNLSKAAAGFRYDRSRGRFRDYVGRIARRETTRQFARRDGTASLPDEGAEVAASSDDTWNREWIGHHYRVAMARLERTHDARSLAIFRSLLDGRSPSDIASEHGVTDAAVRKTKQRLKERLQELIAEQVAAEEDQRV